MMSYANAKRLTASQVLLSVITEGGDLENYLFPILGKFFQVTTLGLTSSGQVLIRGDRLSQVSTDVHPHGLGTEQIEHFTSQTDPIFVHRSDVGNLDNE